MKVINNILLFPSLFFPISPSYQWALLKMGYLFSKPKTYHLSTDTLTELLRKTVFHEREIIEMYRGFCDEFPEVWIIVWLRKSDAQENNLKHVPQEKGFSPVCILVCFWTSSALLNVFGQSLHLCSLNPVYLIHMLG